VKIPRGGRGRFELAVTTLGLDPIGVFEYT